jgi:hypothetical protein
VNNVRNAWLVSKVMHMRTLQKLFFLLSNDILSHLTGVLKLHTRQSETVECVGRRQSGDFQERRESTFPIRKVCGIHRLRWPSEKGASSGVDCQPSESGRFVKSVDCSGRVTEGVSSGVDFIQPS